MLNCFNIRGKNKIFSHHKGDFGYEYYFDPKEPLSIYVEYNIVFDAQYLYRYWIREDRNMKGVYLFLKLSSCNDGPIDQDADIAGFDLKDAIKFLITQITRPIETHDIGANIDELKSKIREALASEKQEG